MSARPFCSAGWNASAVVGTCGGVVKLGSVDLRQVEQAPQIQRSREAVDLLRRDVELADQQVEGEVVHVVADLEADRRAEAATQQLGLEGLDEILGLVLLDDDVLVAGETERVVVEDLHPREEVVEVVRDELLEREVAHGVAVAGDVDEAREHRRHLEPGELLATRSRIADADGEVQRQARDVGERVGRVDGERHQDREDLTLEVLGQSCALVVLEVLPRDDLDAGLRERGPDVRGPGVRVPQLECVRVGGDVGEHLLR